MKNIQMQKKIINYITFCMTFSFLLGGLMNTELVDIKGWQNVVIKFSSLALIETIAVLVIKKKFPEKVE